MVWEIPAAMAVASFIGNERTNSANAAQAEQNRSFQEDMSNTSYQRAVADLKSAGLNPMLAYSKGGATTPSGAQATMTNSAGSAADSFSRGSLIAEQKSNLTAQTGATNADTALKQAQTRNVDADTLIKGGVPELIAAQVVQAHSSASQSIAMASKLQAEIAKVEHEIANIKSSTARNQAETAAIPYLNGLRAAQTYLTGNQAIILKPKADAASNVGGTIAANAENVSTTAKAVWDSVGGLFKRGSKGTTTYYDKHGNVSGGSSYERD